MIDEAAAIPLPIVKEMLGPYLVFLCSTVNGYEGTGELIERRRKGKGGEKGQWRVSEVTEGQPRGRGGAPHTVSVAGSGFEVTGEPMGR